MPLGALRSTNYGAYFNSVGITNTATIPLGYIDYGVFRGWNASVNACYPVAAQLLPGQSIQPAATLALLAPKGTVLSGLNLTKKIHITDMTDGTSNTVIVGESAGKQQVYRLGTAVQPNTFGATGFYLNAAFADYGTRIYVYGFTASGATTGGCSVMNATNAPVNTSFNSGGGGDVQIYSFHTGGANFLRGDGSVVFITNSLQPNVLTALISAQGGEAIPSTYSGL